VRRTAADGTDDFCDGRVPRRLVGLAVAGGGVAERFGFDLVDNYPPPARIRYLWSNIPGDRLPR
jgi:hypothetical protein